MWSILSAVGRIVILSWSRIQIGIYRIVKVLHYPLKKFYDTSSGFRCFFSNIAHSDCIVQISEFKEQCLDCAENNENAANNMPQRFVNKHNSN